MAFVPRDVDGEVRSVASASPFGVDVTVSCAVLCRVETGVERLEVGVAPGNGVAGLGRRVLDIIVESGMLCETAVTRPVE